MAWTHTLMIFALGAVGVGAFVWLSRGLADGLEWLCDPVTHHTALSAQDLAEGSRELTSRS